MIQSISCIGFRGFATKQTLKLAEPNGKDGSGLTVIVGPNGGGKSTLVECFNKISLSNKGVSFSKGRRNLKANDRVSIELVVDGKNCSLETINGGSEAKWNGNKQPLIYYLPSRRYFNPYFSHSKWDRQLYLNNPYEYQFRSSSLENYAYRLVDLNSSGSEQFNSIMERILCRDFQWTIDQEDNGRYIVKITKEGGLYHNSDGLGEGILSLMFIVDALCANQNELIVIDEPELSLHPQLQHRLLRELLDKTKHSQIVISTHSPNLLSLESIINGGIVARVFESDEGSIVKIIDEQSRGFIKSVYNNINNPHILGIDARSCFFAEDGLVITEGQEDVMLYPVVMKELGLSCDIPFFGFGAGGAEGIIRIARLLNALGFKKIGAIYDGDKIEEAELFNKEFERSGYRSWVIPADDIRDKESYRVDAKSGLLSDKKKLKSIYTERMRTIFSELQEYISPVFHK